MPYVPLAGFAPDLDPTAPGILTDCDGWIPSPRGMHTGYTASDAGFTALAATCVSFTVARLADGTNKVYAATATNIYQRDSELWTARTSASVTSYVSTDHWAWAVMGNLTFASSLYTNVQYASAAAFVTAGDAPKARTLATQLGFLLAGNIDDGASKPDYVAWSALNNPQSWAASIATLAGSIQLTDTPGAITGMRAFGQDVIVFKSRSTYLLVFQGAPDLWTRRVVATDVGAVAHEAVIDVNTALLFLGYDDLWMMGFDLVPRPIGVGMREWFFADLDRANITKVQGLFDRDRNLCYWFYPQSGGSGNLTKYICYNLDVQKWGAGSLTITCAAETLSTSTSYDSFGSGSTWDTLPDIPYDSSSFFASLPYPAVFGTDKKMKYLAGASTSATFSTGRVGDEHGVSLLQRLAPRWAIQPTSASLTPRYAMTAGGTLSSGTARDMDSRKRFDLLQAARWHAADFSVVGNAEVSGINWTVSGAGEE